MGILNLFLLSNLFTKKQKTRKRTISNLIINNEIIEKWSVVNDNSVSNTILELSKYKSPQFETGFVCRRKKAFQTITFQQSYDIVVTDKNGKVLDLLIKVEPGFFSKYYPLAHFVYFFPVGSIKHFNLKINNILKIGRKYLV